MSVSCMSLPKGGVWEKGAPPIIGSEDRRLVELERDLGLGCCGSP